MDTRVSLLALVFALAAACATPAPVREEPLPAAPGAARVQDAGEPPRGQAAAPGCPRETEDPSFALGEALVKSGATPRPEALAAGSGVADLVVLETRPVAGTWFLVRFARAADGGTVPADPGYTRRVVAALRDVQGIEASELNAIRRPRADTPNDGFKE